jgi:CRP-like cAMP-binding protein
VGRSTRRTPGWSSSQTNAIPYKHNQILSLLPRASLDALLPSAETVALNLGDSLFDAGDDISHAYFPLDGAVGNLVLAMRDGRAIEAATIGREGLVGGIISFGHKPAFARALVMVPGVAVRIPVNRLETAKRNSPVLHDIMVRYADCLLAQALQSVGCGTLHTLEARCARWLLLMHDRAREPELPLTQEALAEMLGVARTYMTRIALRLQRRGAISYHRGRIRIERRELLEETSCE